MTETGASVGRACRVIGIPRSVYYYRTQKDDREVIEKLQALSAAFPTRGFDKYYGIIRGDGLRWGRSRVLRVYRSLKLSLRRKHKRRLPQRVKTALQAPSVPNESYSMDFMSDALVGGRKLRILNVMDDCTRESLAAWCDYSIPGEKVVDVLQQIIEERGKPKQIRVDNGPEFTGKVFTKWCEQHAIEIKFIQPGRPMQNGYIERLNRTYREDVLDAYLFEDLEEVRMISDEWQHNYNHHYPHDALKGIRPGDWKMKELQPRFATTIEREHRNNDQQQNTQSLLQTEDFEKKSTLGQSEK
jgi:putative transposase